MKTAATTSSTMDGLRELQGMHHCEGACGRVLSGDQGKVTRVGDRDVRTCYSPPCVAKAVDLQRMAAVS